jgi:AcrR family transcriptional regulator
MARLPPVVTPPLAAASEPKQERAHRTRQRLLDAAVEELVEHGYANVTTEGVARRAKVSRGAQQNHFPHKTTLVAEAVRHLGARQIDALHTSVAEVPRGQARARVGLDILFEQYSGPLFAAVVDLSLAARNDAAIHEVVCREERKISKSVAAAAKTVLGEDPDSGDELSERWVTVLSAIRGLALLKLLGHPHDVVDRQWVATRRHLLALLE